jgi:fumarate reductase subunit C
MLAWLAHDLNSLRRWLYWASTHFSALARSIYLKGNTRQFFISRLYISTQITEVLAIVRLKFLLKFKMSTSESAGAGFGSPRQALLKVSWCFDKFYHLFKLQQLVNAFRLYTRKTKNSINFAMLRAHVFVIIHLSLGEGQRQLQFLFLLIGLLNKPIICNFNFSSLCSSLFMCDLWFRNWPKVLWFFLEIAEKLKVLYAIWP